MRKLLAATVITAALATPAFAADLRPMPAKAPPMAAVVAAYNWTGFYLGATWEAPGSTSR
jgi:outer membrane immunogenic protein